MAFLAATSLRFFAASAKVKTRVLAGCLLFLCTAGVVLGQGGLVFDENMKILNAQMPNETYQFVA